MYGLKRMLATVAVSVAVAVSVLTATSVNQTAAAAGSSYHGCPYGAVCIYPRNSGFNGGHWTYAFYSYAGHNIYNQYGLHRIVDNQYGGHYTGLCAKANGKGGFIPYDGHIRGEGGTSHNPTYWDANLTPVNSIDLRPYSQEYATCHR